MPGTKGNSGGTRIGAGRRKKPLAEKVLEGNPGKRPLTVVDFNDAPALNGAAVIDGADMPPPRAYLKTVQKNGKQTKAAEIYEQTWKWLHERRCSHLIPVQVLEQYAQTVARWVQVEEAISEFGFLAKHPTTGAAMASPYVKMSQDFMKQANTLWVQIYQIVCENNLAAYDGKTPHEDAMERLLSARKGG